MQRVLILAVLACLVTAGAPRAAPRSDPARQVPDYTKYEPEVIAAVAKRVHVRLVKVEAALAERERDLEAAEAQLAEARKLLAARDREIHQLRALLTKAGVRIPQTPRMPRTPGKGVSARPTSQPARPAESKQQQASNRARARRFAESLQRLGVNDMVVSRVVVDGVTARLTVTPGWDMMPHELRLDTTKHFYRAWAGAQSKSERMTARLELLDAAGTVIGGSREDNPRSIWAKKE